MMLGGNYLKYAEIIIDHKASKVDRPFTYQAQDYQDDDIKVGVRVVVPFGRNNTPTLGVVISTSDKTDLKGKIKYILQALDTKPIISIKMIQLARWIREEYLCTFFEALSVILPPGDFRDINSIIFLREKDIENISLDVEEIEIVNFLKKEKQTTYTDLRDSLNLKSINNKLLKLENKGIININIDIKKRVSVKYENILSKSKDITYEEGLQIIGNSAKKQRIIWQSQWDNARKTEKQILRDFNTSSTVLRELILKGLIHVDKEIVNEEAIEVAIPNYEKIKLNKEQELVYKKILKSNFSSYLLHGITGSGKTEVYLQLVEEFLKQGKDSIILVPEISLTPQTIDRFVGRFGNKVAILHSRLTKA